MSSLQNLENRAEESYSSFVGTQSRGETPSVASLEAARASVLSAENSQTDEIREPNFLQGSQLQSALPSRHQNIEAK